jgi:hypothetical protein
VLFLVLLLLLLQADDVVRKHRMAPLQAQRRNLAVVGLVHCPLAEDLGAAMEEFTRSSRCWGQRCSKH